MRILIAPDKFKGLLSAREAAEAIREGLREVLPEAQFDMAPVADGGEGTAEIIAAEVGGERVTLPARDALGREVAASYFLLRESTGTRAIIDSSAALGLWRLKPEERDPVRASSGGLGDMLLDAERRGVDAMMVGLGGTATNDAGVGMAQVFGYRFLDEAEQEIGPLVPDLSRLAKIILPEHEFCSVLGLFDVRNPLLGPRGATRTFAMQKGASAERLDILEEAVARLAEVVARDMGDELSTAMGAGAAGGLGYGLMAFCDADLENGFEAVAHFLHLDTRLAAADFVVTGEGQLDDQTFNGKAPAAVAALAKKHRKPCVAVVGRAEPEVDWRGWFDQLVEAAPDRLPKGTSEARMRLRDAARNVARGME